MENSGWPQRIGRWGLYLFAFCGLLSVSIATLGLAALTLAFLWEFRDWRALGRDPLIRVCLFAGAYVVVQSATIYFTAPSQELAQRVAEGGSEWLKLLLFVPFAYWASDRPDRARLLLLLALLGFTVAFLRKIDWANFGPAFFYTRFESYLPAIAFGMYAGLGALGLIALRESFWSEGASGIPRWARIACWLFILALMLQGLFLSYSRGTWIAFALAVFLLTYLEWRARRGPTEGKRKRMATWALSWLVVAIAITAFLYAQSDRIAQRMLYEHQTVAQIMRGDWSDVKSNSVGLRIHALRFAARLWSERPWFGWGAGSSGYLIAQSGRPGLRVDETHTLAHLHNSYAEVLVQFGTVGAILAALLVGLLVRESSQECSRGTVPAALCRFLLISLVFVSIWCLINYRVVRHDWTSFWILFAGTAFSFRLRSLVRSPPPRPESSPSGGP
jgi:O-antigen ligase